MLFYFLFNILGIVVPSLFIRTIWKNWHLPVSHPLILFIIVVFSICVLSLIGMTVFTIGTNLHNKLNLILGFTTTTLWFWVTYEYIKKEKIPYKLLILISIEPIFMIILTLTNNYHGLNTNDTANTVQQIQVPVIKFIQVFHVIYGLSIIVFSLVWLGNYLLNNSKLGLFKVLLLILILCLPTIAFLLYALGNIPVRIGAPFSIVLILLGVSRFKLLDIVPIAREKIIDELKDGVAIINNEGLIVDANGFAGEFLGLSIDNENQKFTPTNCPAIISNGFDLRGMKIQQQEMRYLKNQNEESFVNVQLLPLIGKQKESVGHLLIIQDVTQQKNAGRALEFHIDELENSRQKLQQLDQLKSDFLTNISHEFRTPLTLTLGPINDILEGQFGEISHVVNQQLKSVRKHNRHLLELINQLLELSRLESVGKLSHQQINETIDLVDLLPANIASFESIAIKKQVEIKFATVLDSAVIHMQLINFEKIINNLLSNALKSISKKGTINIVMSKTDSDDFEMSVKDTGCGIAANLLPHIFERFYYSEHQHPQWSASTGIGLALVKQLIESHNGSISVSSEVGKGSLFTVNLPMSRSTQITSKNKLSHPVNTPKTNFNVPVTLNNEINNKAESIVLLIEDNDDMRLYIMSHLNNAHHVLEANNGEQGLLLAQNHVPDLIISDVMMPGMDGVELCKTLKSDVKTSHIPIILLTAKARTQDKLEGLEVAADDYLTKPFNPKELNVRVNNLISQRIKLRQHYAQIFSTNVENLVEIEKTHLGKEELFLRDLQQKMMKHMAWADMKISDLASEMCITERQLQRKLRSLTGKSPIQWMLDIRINYAAKLLRETSMNITQIIHESGFNSSSYFSKKFKLIYGQSPTSYRKSLIS